MNVIELFENFFVSDTKEKKNYIVTISLGNKFKHYDDLEIIDYVRLFLDNEKDTFLDYNLYFGDGLFKNYLYIDIKTSLDIYTNSADMCEFQRRFVSRVRSDGNTCSIISVKECDSNE